MSKPNPEKSYQQQPMPVKADGVELPANWLELFGNLIAVQLLALSGYEKATFISNLHGKLGQESDYTLKESLVDAAQFIYVLLTNEKNSLDMKIAIAKKVIEGVAQCLPGFHNRLNEIIISTTTPANLDALLAVQRQAIVTGAAAAALHQLEQAGKLNLRTEVHTYNRFFVIACSHGYGVRAINNEDIYQGQLSAEHIVKDLQIAFTEKYTFFNVLNELFQQLVQLMKERGYAGRCDAGYPYEAFSKFDNEFLLPYLYLPASALFITVEDDNDIPIVVDIHWLNIKKALINKLREEQYFLLTDHEEKYLNLILNDQLSSANIHPESKTLVHSDSEWMQAVAYLHDLVPTSTVWLVRIYLMNRNTDEINKMLAKMPADTSKDVLLAMAMMAGNGGRAFALVEEGADINLAIDFFFSTRHADTLRWLHKNPRLLDEIADSSLPLSVCSGKFKGMKIASIFVKTKKGLQLLSQSAALRAKCQAVLGGDLYVDYLKPFQDMDYHQHVGLYKANVKPIVTEFLQAVADSNHNAVVGLLGSNPGMRIDMLTGKCAVKYRSTQYVYGNALQIARQLINAYHFSEYGKIILTITKWLELHNLLQQQLAESLKPNESGDYHHILRTKLTNMIDTPFRTRWLFAAVKEDNLDALQAVLYPPSDKNRHGVTDQPITGAEICQMKNQTGCSLLKLAITRNNQAVLDFLFEVIYKSGINHANNDKTMLYYAVWLNQSEETISMVLKKSDINARTCPKYCAIHIAALNNKMAMMKTLLKLGADINSLVHDGANALHLAVYERNLEMMAFLLAAGIDVNKPRLDDGLTPLHMAVINKDIPAADLLLQHGAKPNLIKGKLQTTALHDAVTDGHIDMVKLLIKYDANINLAFSSGSTPLHIAAVLNHLEIVNLLIELGVDTSMKLTKRGKTALDIAIEYKHFHAALAIYDYDLSKRPDDSHLYSIQLFGKSLIELGCSAGPKRKALVALKAVLAGSAEASTLAEYANELNNGRLKVIMKGLGFSANLMRQHPPLSLLQNRQ